MIINHKIINSTKSLVRCTVIPNVSVALFKGWVGFKATFQSCSVGKNLKTGSYQGVYYVASSKARFLITRTLLELDISWT